MKIKSRFSHPVPRRLRVSAIVLYPYVLFSEPREHVSESVFRHEMIHVRQIRRLGPIWFYLRYLAEFVALFVWYRNAMRAYLSISFEREAYTEQDRVVLSFKEANEIKQNT